MTATSAARTLGVLAVTWAIIGWGGTLAFAIGRRPDWGSHEWMGEAAPYIALAMFLAVAAYMVRTAQRDDRASA